MSSPRSSTEPSARKLATLLKEHRSVIRNCNIKASLMAARCVDTGHDVNLVETKILGHVNSWTARLFKEAWLRNKNSINKCTELPRSYSVLRVAISRRSIRPFEQNSADFFQKIVKTVPCFFYLFCRRFEVRNRNFNMNLTTQSQCFTFSSFFLFPGITNLPH